MDADVIIIGTGQAGVPLATRLAAAGKRVTIIERAAPGGTCVNFGCTPTKTMIASAQAAHVARTAGRLGVRVGRGDGGPAGGGRPEKRDRQALARGDRAPAVRPSGSRSSVGTGGSWGRAPWR